MRKRFYSIFTFSTKFARRNFLMIVVGLGLHTKLSCHIYNMALLLNECLVFDPSSLASD